MKKEAISKSCGCRVPTHMRSRNGEYLSVLEFASLPDGIVVTCKWGKTIYDRAYKLKGEWFLYWDDKPMPEPDSIQVRKGVYMSVPNWKVDDLVKPDNN